MKMDKQVDRILRLLAGYYRDSLSEEETAELKKWLYEWPENRKLFEELKDEQVRENAFREMDNYDDEKALQKLKLYIVKHRSRRTHKRRYVVAAAIILLIASGYLLLKEKERLHSGQHSTTVVQQNVPSGGSKAVLTLANGKQIILDSNANGLLAWQGNTQVFSLSSGRLVYKMDKENKDADEIEQYNMLATPKDEQYQVILPDGSKVWLNAGSSLRYPVPFTAKRRIVLLAGEAYFEVAKNEQRPFIIHTRKVRIRVLGTHLNVCAYPSEGNIQVAVVSGKVEVAISAQKGNTEKGNTEKVILRANQIATCAKSTMELRRRNIADASDYSSWRNGELSFHHTLIADVVQELQRVYGVKFILENKAINNCVISGNFEVHQPIEQIIKSICLSIGAHYEFRDEQVVISGPGCK